MACGCRDAATCGCRLDADAPITVAGAGSIDVPFSVGLTLSPNPDNILTLEPDGLAAIESQFPGHCFQDDLGVALAPDNITGCYVIPRRACVLDPGGTPLAEDDNGCVTLPEAGIPAYSTGLTTNTGGALMVALSDTWPIKDLTGTNFVGAASGGAPIFADEVGKIRTVPDHTALQTTSGTVTVLSGSAFISAGSTVFSTAAGQITLHNPSPSRSMLVRGGMWWACTCGGPSSGAFYMAPQINTGGGVASIPGLNLYPPYNASGSLIESTLYGFYQIAYPLLAPGATATLDARLALNNSGSGSQAIRDTSYLRTHLFGVSQ